MTPTRASRGRSPPRATRRGALRGDVGGGGREADRNLEVALVGEREIRARRASASTPPAMAAISRDIAASTDAGKLASRGVGRARACLASRRSRRAAFVSARRSTWTSRRVDVDAPRDAVSRATAAGARRSRPLLRAPHHFAMGRAPPRARVDADRSDAEGISARRPRARCARRAPARELPAPPRAPSRAAPPGHGDGILLGGITPAASDFT